MSADATISCGRCGTTSPWDHWRPDPKDDSYQCPKCGLAFRRVRNEGEDKWRRPIIIQPITRR